MTDPHIEPSLAEVILSNKLGNYLIAETDVRAWHARAMKLAQSMRHEVPFRTPSHNWENDVNGVLSGKLMFDDRCTKCSLLALLGDLK